MPLFTTNQLYEMLPSLKLDAIGAFNVHNMEYTQAVVEAANRENKPVILMIGEPILKFAKLDMLSTIALFAAEKSKVPIAVALDHGKNIENCIKCVDLGMSVMVDGSNLPFEENIKLTSEIVNYAHAKNISVEAELGSLGGIEDIDDGSVSHLTDPNKAVEFVERTKADSLAISIGNAHGIYVKKVVLDFERLKQINEKVNVPLVLHGGSDLPDEIILKTIEYGIKKINIGTDLKFAFSSTMRNVLNKEPMPFQPQDTLGVAREAVLEKTIEKIRLISSNKKGRR